jgi:hypothetical protein
LQQADWVNGLGTIAVAGLTAWSFLTPMHGGWAFAAAEFAFLAWLAATLRKASASGLRARARPALGGDEDELVGRYPFYFERPPIAREHAATLAALGLASLVLVPWLIYRGQWAQAALIGMFVFAVARLTRALSPVLALRMATAKGDRDALRLLAAHDGAARKLSAPDQPEADGEGGRQE